MSLFDKELIGKLTMNKGGEKHPVLNNYIRSWRACRERNKGLRYDELYDDWHDNLTAEICLIAKEFL